MLTKLAAKSRQNKHYPSENSRLPKEGGVVREIGDWLRKAREQKGLSIIDVQDITKIRARYLEAIEAEDFAKLPGEAYTRAFIRTYAVGIGLEPGPLMTRYHDLYDCTAADTVTQSSASAQVSAPVRLMRNLFATLNGTMEWLGL